MEKCFFCKGIMEDGYSNYMADLDGHFLIVRNVPCHRCRQCGEVSYSGEVAAQLQRITERLKDALAEIAIVEYAVA